MSPANNVLPMVRAKIAAVREKVCLPVEHNGNGHLVLLLREGAVSRAEIERVIGPID